jgi:hypothetical protein
LSCGGALAAIDSAACLPQRKNTNNAQHYRQHLQTSQRRKETA